MHRGCVVHDAGWWLGKCGCATSAGVEGRSHTCKVIVQAPTPRPSKRFNLIRLPRQCLGNEVIKLHRTDTTLDLSQKAEKGMPTQGQGGARGRDTRSRPCKTLMVGHSPLAPNTNDCMVELPDPKCWHGSLMSAQGAANMFWTYHAMAVRSEQLKAACILSCALHILLPSSAAHVMYA